MASVTVTGLRGSFRVFQVRISLPEIALSLPSFPPGLGAIPVPKLPVLPSLPDFSSIVIAAGFLSNMDITFPKIPSVRLPSVSLSPPSFPPGLGAIPVPKLPVLPSLPQLPDISADAFQFGADVVAVLPVLPNINLPSVSLSPPSFPPGLGAIPVPKLPQIPKLPDGLLESLQGLDTPYAALDVDGVDVMSEDLRIEITS